MKNTEKQDILKRMEVMEGALNTALEAVLEIQSEYKLLYFLLTQEDTKNKER